MASNDVKRGPLGSPTFPALYHKEFKSSPLDLIQLFYCIILVAWNSFSVHLLGTTSNTPPPASDIIPESHAYSQTSRHTASDPNGHVLGLLPMRRRVPLAKSVKLCGLPLFALEMHVLHFLRRPSLRITRTTLRMQSNVGMRERQMQLYP